MFSTIKVIAFDADDTLWVNEPYFRTAEKAFCELLKEYVPEDKEEKLIRQELLDQVKDMKEVLGLRSLSILRYIDPHFCGILT